MNIGRDFDKATSQARANASLAGEPRYLHLYNGVFWLSPQPPACGHWKVTPDGQVTRVKE